MATSEAATVPIVALRSEVENARFVNVSIKCYEKRPGSGFKDEYYAYRVVSIISSDSEDDMPTSQGRSRYEVWHRYSDFDMLKSFLHNVYPYVVIPPLPEKAIKGSGGLLSKITFTGEDPEFLLSRQQALEIFLVRVSRHPLLSKNYWFHEFLQKACWKELVILAGFSGKAIQNESVFSNLSLQLSKQAPDGRFQDVKQYANDLESVFKGILDTREKMASHLKAMYKVHNNYGRVFNEMSSTEDVIGTGLQVAGGCTDSYADSVDSYVEEEETRLIIPLKEYTGFCDSLRFIVRRQEILQRQLEKAEEHLSAKSTAKETLDRNKPEEGAAGGGARGSKFSFRNLSARLRGEDTSYEGQLAIAEKDVREAEKDLEESQQQFEEYTQKSLDEIELFINQKRGDFKSLLINFVQLQMHMHKKGASTFERVQQAFEVTEQETL